MNIESMTDKEFAEHIDLCLALITPDNELSGKAIYARLEMAENKRLTALAGRVKCIDKTYVSINSGY